MVETQLSMPCGPWTFPVLLLYLRREMQLASAALCVLWGALLAQDIRYVVTLELMVS